MLRDGGRARQQLERGRGQGEFWLHRLEPQGPRAVHRGHGARPLPGIIFLLPPLDFVSQAWVGPGGGGAPAPPGWGPAPWQPAGRASPGGLWLPSESEPAGRLQEAGSRQVRLRVREQSRQGHKAWAGCGSCTGWGLFLSWGFMCQLAQSAHLWGPQDAGRPPTPTPTPSPSGPSWGLGLVGASPCSAPLW